jgi:hypothetical protein
LSGWRKSDNVGSTHGFVGFWACRICDSRDLLTRKNNVVFRRAVSRSMLERRRRIGWLDHRTEGTSMDQPIELRMSNGRMAFGDVPEHIDLLLQEAVQARDLPDQCEAILWQAHKAAPRVLPVYYALYKFYFNRKRLADAERVARIGLDAAAREGGFTADWGQLTAATTDWTALGAPRFFLFTMKALAFIELRRHNRDKALAILAKMAELDPVDQVGYGTVAALARGLGEG